jgi:hypothetical protein
LGWEENVDHDRSDHSTILKNIENEEFPGKVTRLWWIQRKRGAYIFVAMTFLGKFFFLTKFLVETMVSLASKRSFRIILYR